METLKVQIAEGQKELVVRQGEALPLKEPKKILIAGNIFSIKNFLEKRSALPGSISVENTQLIDKSTAIVLADREAMTLKLELNPEYAYGTEIFAKLERSLEVQNFKINTEQTFTREQLIKLLRFSSFYFDDKTKYDELLRAYQSFNAKAYIDMQQDGDQRGNQVKNFTKKVESGLPDKVMLCVPIFKGLPKEKFLVEICLDVSSGGAIFWFESPDLRELELTRLEEIFTEQLEACKDFPIIYKN